MISFLIWIAISLFLGAAEAVYFYKTKNPPANIHMYFTAMRVLILGGIFLFNRSYIDLLYPLVFTFFHDGMYYVVRDKLDHSYPLGWWSQSTTSTSFLDKLELTTPILRTISCVVGTALIVYLNN